MQKPNFNIYDVTPQTYWSPFVSKKTLDKSEWEYIIGDPNKEPVGKQPSDKCLRQRKRQSQKQIQKRRKKKGYR